MVKVRFVVVVVTVMAVKALFVVVGTVREKAWVVVPVKATSLYVPVGTVMVTIASVPVSSVTDLTARNAL
uniref:Secreted protein n=1 Tax=Peronospora matthiolae TaxID=2874970 RepID=A0AAV1UVP4_9STRA